MRNEKAEHMHVGSREQKEELRISGHIMQRVNVIKYLGSVISDSVMFKLDMESRITRYGQNAGVLYLLIKDKNILQKVKSNM